MKNRILLMSEKEGGSSCVYSKKREQELLSKGFKRVEKNNILDLKPMEFGDFISEDTYW
jgi:hypothetical protein